MLGKHELVLQPSALCNSNYWGVMVLEGTKKDRDVWLPEIHKINTQILFGRKCVNQSEAASV